jgi:hypothetical protein
MCKFQKMQMLWGITEVATQASTNVPGSGNTFQLVHFITKGENPNVLTFGLA